MPSFTRRSFLFAAAAAPAVRAQASKQPLRRKDCFFGLHFDLHPNPKDTALGRDVTDEMIDRLLAGTTPDYVQYDCKGHVGWLGYPKSEVSRSAPGIVKDSLELWRKATARRGIGLYVHFSGVWDSLAVEEHPEWARVTAEGKPDARQTSTFGPYVDKRMIPQLREVARRYAVDGAWVDGECWATGPDYAKAAVERWGSEPPRKPGEPRWQEWLEFHREQFRRYVKHYVDALHQSHPKLQVASNWLYTTYVPERPTLPVDFVSGDYLGNASMETARLESRYLSAAGVPWDLMAWGFQRGQSNPVGFVHKSAVHLMQEAAVVLAQGGGFQVYYQPTRSGYFDEKLVGTMADVAKFCRSRQAWSHKTRPVPQVGVLFSGHSLYRTSDKLFGGWPGHLTAAASGVVSALVENHYSVDVLPDWALGDAAGSYKCIVVPDWKDIGDEAQRTLETHARRGGVLVVFGAENAQRFAAAAGLRTEAPAEGAWFVPGSSVVGNVRGSWAAVYGGQTIERRFPTSDLTRDASPAAVIAGAGSGRIVLVPGPIGSIFANTHAPAVREFVNRVVEAAWKPLLRVDAPPVIEVALRQKDGATILHLLNSSNMQVASNYATTDFIPTVGPIKIALELPEKPRRATLQPEGRVLAGSWSNGVWTATVPSVHIHSAVVLET